MKAQLNISPGDQKLMLRGKKLQEGTLLGDYNLREGDRLHLVVSKAAKQLTKSTLTFVNLAPSGEKRGNSRLARRVCYNTCNWLH